MSQVLIIGAGAAGLAAAAELTAQGQSVCVLEARKRIGGRCYSVLSGAAHAGAFAGALPAELGAEFVHGAAAATDAIMQRHALASIDAAGERWLARRGRLQPANDAFVEMVRAFARAPWLRRGDRSFADYLACFDADALSDSARQLALRLVEGFDAADPQRVSARAIVQEWSGEGVLGEQQARPLGGYGAMLGALAAQSTAQGADIRTGTLVRHVAWRKGEVQVEFERAAGRAARQTLRADQLIVTVPLGVLKQASHRPGAIAFDPPLQAKRRALDHLESGPVVKLVLEFRSAFWERVDKGRYRNAAFLLGPGRRIPTFWTAVPARMPRIVAWAGGQRAQALAGLDAPTLADIALADLLALLRCSRRYAGQLERIHYHDWQADPYARGAYSYVTVSGARARRQLARSLAGTLHFAGEATDYSGEAATVAGAIVSGQRAARAVLRAS